MTPRRATDHDVDERGSAAVLGVVLVGALSLVAVLLSGFGGAVADQRRVEAAADLGALAGATAAQQGRPGCAAAAGTVAANHARLVSCTLRAGVVDVRAARRTGPVLGWVLTLTSRSRAGPAGVLPP